MPSIKQRLLVSYLPENCFRRKTIAPRARLQSYSFLKVRKRKSKPTQQNQGYKLAACAYIGKFALYLQVLFVNGGFALNGVGIIVARSAGAFGITAIIALT